MADMLSGIAALHQQYVIHRDIKPANLLLSTDGLLKISDFGLAVHCETDTYPAGFGGTLAYLAPEIVRGTDPADFPGRGVDVWAAGCVAVEMLAGVHPFMDFERAESPQATIERISLHAEDVMAKLACSHGRDEKPVAELLGRAAPLVMAMLDAAPDERITASAALEGVYLSMNKPYTFDPTKRPGKAILKKGNGKARKS